jgi:hypothetical protein
MANPPGRRTRNITDFLSIVALIQTLMRCLPSLGVAYSKFKESGFTVYADDTLIYTGQQKQEMVYEVLEAAPDEVLLTIHEGKLAGSKPRDFFYIMNWIKKAQKIRVGTEFIEESYAEDYLGVKISKNLTWTKQFEALKSELSRQIGVIRRLSHHLPKAAMKKVINPMFTSKVQYALEIFGDSTSQICKDKEEDTIIKKTCRSCTTWQ